MKRILAPFLAIARAICSLPLLIGFIILSITERRR